MNRERFIELYTKIVKSISLSMEEVIELMMDYCLSKGKKVEEIQIYIQLASSLGILNDNIQQILEDYSKEFNICKVIDGNNKVLLIY